MDPSHSNVELSTFAIRLVVTLFFVLANGFFVAAEFALVKVRPAQLRALAQAGNRRGRVAIYMHDHMDRFLSACQLGITLSSLILGWLAEPAVAELLLRGAAGLGLGIAPDNPVLHIVALGLALTVITFLHMTIGEQAPKIWAINRAESTSLLAAYPLKGFEIAFRPFIWVINESSNALLRLAGMGPDELGEASHNVEELRSILEASSQAGHISGRQREIAENVFGMIDLEVRHILVPRIDVVYLSLQNSPEENLRIVRESSHSRFPLCEVGLDSVVGLVHAKDVVRWGSEHGPLPDFEKLARAPLFVSDTQPLARLIARMQRARTHCAVVVDEHGSSVGLAFLEDAIEEIVGPIRDEFDEEEDVVRRPGNGILELPGSLALPEAAALLGVSDLGEESDTIGGHVVAMLGRLPRPGDEIQIGHFRGTVRNVEQRRITWLRFEPGSHPIEPEAATDEEVQPPESGSG